MTYVFNPNLDVGVNASSSSQAAGRKTMYLRHRTNPVGFRVAMSAAQAPGQSMDTRGLPRAALEMLQAAGVVVDARHVSPEVKFVNPLSALARQHEGAPDTLVWNPKVWLQEDARWPKAVQRVTTHLAAIDTTQPLLWIGDAATGFLHPVQLERRTLPAIRKAIRLRSTKGLSSSLRAALFGAGALIDPRSARAAQRARREAQRAARRELATRKYAVLRQVLPASFLAATRRYLRAYDAAGHLMRKQDLQEPHRDTRHNEPLNRFIHAQLSRFIGPVVSAPIKPSYCYLAVYRFGSNLLRHVDRPQCEWNMSLQLDNQPEISVERAWPIFIEIEGKDELVKLGLGDTVLYSGKELPHGRPPLPRGRTTTVCFFHFVDRHFQGSLD